MSTILPTAPFVTEVTKSHITAEFISNMKGPIVRVAAYDEYSDCFHISITTAAPCDDQQTTIPAQLFAFLVREYGEPDEFIGRSFLLSEPSMR